LRRGVEATASQRDQSFEVVLVEGAGDDAVEGSALPAETFEPEAGVDERTPSEDLFWYASAYQPPPLRWKAEALISFVTLARQCGQRSRGASEIDWLTSKVPHLPQLYS